MDGASGNPPSHRMEDPPTGPLPPPVKSTLEVDEAERFSRKDLSQGHDDGTFKAAQLDAVRYLSPSPAPSSRLSAEPRSYTGPLLRDSQGPQPRGSVLQRFWVRNKGACFVAGSQLFGALMNLSARLVELEGDGMHPVQVLLMRQSLTSICCLAYMWWMETPSAPFGTRDIRLLLLIRGVAGFFGIFGLVYPPSISSRIGRPFIWSAVNILTRCIGCGTP
jgi:hypothetical protein